MPNPKKLFRCNHNTTTFNKLHSTHHLQLLHTQNGARFFHSMPSFQFTNSSHKKNTPESPFIHLNETNKSFHIPNGNNNASSDNAPTKSRNARKTNKFGTITIGGKSTIQGQRKPQAPAAPKSRLKSSPPPVSAKEAHIRAMIDINPVYRSWLKSPTLRQKELRTRRQQALDQFKGKSRAQVQEEYLQKYASKYLDPQQLSLNQIIMHRPIPDHLACSSFEATSKKTTSYTYLRVNTYSNKLAYFLKLKGLKKGDAIGVMLHEDHNLSVVMMACLRSGFVYVPMDPTQMTPVQLEHRLRDANCKWILSHVDFQDLAQLLQEQICEEFDLEESVSRKSRESNNFDDDDDDDATLQTGDTSSTRTPPLQILNWTDFGVETPRDVKDYAVEGREFFLYEDVNSISGEISEEVLRNGLLVPQKEMDVQVSPDDTMCIVYTINEEGDQQGIRVPYRALASIHAYIEISLHVEEEQKLWISPSAHTPYGVLYNVIGNLLLGSQAFYAHGQNTGSFHMAAIRALEIESLVVTDYFLEGLIKDARTKSSSFLKAPQLQKVTFTGSAMNPHLVKPFEDVWGCKFHNHYGTSEDGMLLTQPHHPVFDPKSDWWQENPPTDDIPEVEQTQTNEQTGGDALKETRVPVSPLGVAQLGTKLVLLNEQNNELNSMDEVGQLAVDVDASPFYWFKDYVNHTLESEKKFVTSSGRRYALTGDMMRRTPTLYHNPQLPPVEYEFAGRQVSIVTHMGKKVDVDHVEQVMRSHPGVVDAVIVDVPQARGSVLMCFAIRKDTGVETSKQDLDMESELILDWAANQADLNLHEIPQQFLFVESFPSSSDRVRTRKIMRKGFSTSS